MHRWQCFGGVLNDEIRRTNDERNLKLESRSVRPLPFIIGSLVLFRISIFGIRISSRRDLMHVTHPLWLAELYPQKMVGTKSAALFASRMSNERSADELRPQNGAGERSCTVVSALARPHSPVEPHPQKLVSPAGLSPSTWSLGRSRSVF